MFIVFEGIDGSGKTTQSKLLVNYLKKLNKKVFLTKEPTYKIAGNVIKKALDGRKKLNSLAIQLLMMAERSEHTEEIVKMLKKGYFVICDRYFFSTIAYGSAENKNLYDALFDFNLKLFPLPNVLIYLKVRPEIAIKRIKKGRKIFEKLNLLKKIEEKYEEILKDRRINKIVKIIKINGEKSIKNVYEDIIKEINKVFVKYERKNV
ncbi:MAG: dTMP kinase [Candidatus Aenigmarchaeota archaeon]|nr:dTMP kinase [Candidatus Aenigmarchaeota archaeon]MDW8149177.1 dTMP kinase [Candidatus Aenigmarchaeota archaeon]